MTEREKHYKFGVDMQSAEIFFTILLVVPRVHSIRCVNSREMANTGFALKTGNSANDLSTLGVYRVCIPYIPRSNGVILLTKQEKMQKLY